MSLVLFCFCFLRSVGFVLRLVSAVGVCKGGGYMAPYLRLTCLSILGWDGMGSAWHVRGRRGKGKGGVPGSLSWRAWYVFDNQREAGAREEEEGSATEKQEKDPKKKR